MRNPEITFFTGLMKAGKSKQLILNIEKAEELGANVLILKPTVDTRDGCKVKSRALEKTYDAVPYDSNNYQTWRLVLNGIEFYETVFIDEVQFMPDDYLAQIASRCWNHGVDLVVSGLTYDVFGNTFDSALWLNTFADKIIWLDSNCDCCIGKADRDIRLVDDELDTSGEAVVIDGTDNVQYMTICRYCYEAEVGF